VGLISTFDAAGFRRVGETEARSAGLPRIAVRLDPRDAVSVTIRAATERDIEAMRAIEVDAGGRFRAIGLHVVADDPPPEPEALLGYITCGLAWIAEGRADDGHPVPVGYALASTVDGEGHLDQVSVLEQATGRGIGSALVDVVLSWSAASGHPAVTLTTYGDVPWNGPWYARRGFVEVPDERLTPRLRAILERERAIGLEPPTRIAMRRAAAHASAGDPRAR
jgi:GNAT superfamily N-acetyltransferase